MNHLYLHCRPGFEKECAAEITDVANTEGVFGFSRTDPGTALVTYQTYEPDGAQRLMQTLDLRTLIFARQWLAGPAPLKDLDPRDRLGPLMKQMLEWPAVCEVWGETTDTNEGKQLSTLARKFSRPALAALKQQQKLERDSRWRLHLLFLSGTDLIVGLSSVINSAPWPMGIARLRQPKTAPSRATLKLEEAWHQFVPADEWEHRLRSGMRAVDLGAAPGGWTWQLVRRNMWVDAVDNGPMADELMDSGLVTHHREDGFVYQPKKPVDWLVCDIADKPARVTDMVGRWLSEGLCREAVFNLKLPMKQRYPEVCKRREQLREMIEQAGLGGRVAFKQLYHDREEVTGHVVITRPD